MTRWARVAIALVLFSPLLFILLRIDQWSLPPISEVVAAAKSSFVQASLSSLSSIAGGILGALGLLRLHRRRRLVELFLLAPSFFPSLFVILACLQVIKPFPFGIWGITFTHTIVYVGLCSVVLASIIESKAGAVAELALVEGASRRLFFTKGLLPLIKRDLLGLWIFVFVACLASFAIPLVVGGTQSNTLEVLIYEKAVIGNDLSQAVGVGLLQSVVIFLLLFFMRAPLVAQQRRNHNLSGFSLLLGLSVPAFATLIVLMGLASGLSEGVAQLRQLHLGWGEFFVPALGTLIVGLGVGAITLVLLVTIALGFPHQRFEKFLKSFVAPSTSLLGVSFMTFGSMSLAEQGEIQVLVKIIVGISLLTLTSLYRLRMASALEGLSQQWEVATALGANPIPIFWRIVLPQVLPEALFLAGVASFWACGDFALSGFFAGSDVTLALVTESLLGSYRLEAASVTSIVLLGLGVMCFCIFWRLSDVYRKKLVS